MYHAFLHDTIKHVILTNESNDNKTTLSVFDIHSLGSAQILFRIVPVVIYGRSSSVRTFAFFDEDSSRTLLD